MFSNLYTTIYGLSSFNCVAFVFQIIICPPQCEQSACGPHLFQCHSGSQCVSNTQVLNSTLSSEHSQNFTKFLTIKQIFSRCSIKQNYFLNQVCNGANNCEDGSDERSMNVFVLKQQNQRTEIFALQQFYTSGLLSAILQLLLHLHLVFLLPSLTWDLLPPRLGYIVGVLPAHFSILFWFSLGLFLRWYATRHFRFLLGFFLRWYTTFFETTWYGAGGFS